MVRKDRNACLFLCTAFKIVIQSHKEDDEYEYATLYVCVLCHFYCFYLVVKQKGQISVVNVNLNATF